MKPLDPAEYAALQSCAAENYDGDGTEDLSFAEASLVSVGFIATAEMSEVTEDDEWEHTDTWTELTVTESGHRALRVHAAYLASVGGAS